MSAKFTPGPWHYAKATKQIFTPDGELLRVSGVAQPCGYVDPEDECFGNSRLIAAAPDLLELAKACLEWIDAVPQETPLPAMPGFDRDWANGIIAKATA